jgi:hypothetical protein
MTQTPSFKQMTMIDLDDPSLGPWVIRVTTRGQTRFIDSAALQALLEAPAAVHPRGAKASAPAPARKGKIDRRQLDPEKLTHAMVSTRITKIYHHALPTRSLRPAHVGILSEILEQFDWEIPEHPNTRLDQQLAEIVQWPATPAELKAQAQKFLKEYLAARGQTATPQAQGKRKHK